MIMLPLHKKSGAARNNDNFVYVRLSSATLPLNTNKNKNRPINTKLTSGSD